MTKLDYTKAKRPRRRPKTTRREKLVHPNSTAARKWGRRVWNGPSG